ncbi:MAG TPA: carboxypeptidase-like regulatory domain-containing protein, partial [Chitinophagales bacterium]|nr:carboxypeptidase-like regulatory domain-containing protein [Chitinophagales bacterium]
MTLQQLRHISLIILLSGALCAAFAQQLHTVGGKIIDAETKEPMPGAHVVFSRGELFSGAVTDSSGTFKIEKTPAGKYEVRVTFIGYEPFLLQQVDVSPAGKSFFTFEIVPSAAPLKEVVVQASRKADEPLNTMAVASARSFTIETAEKFAASMRDPSRLALSFAGVRGQSDILNG